MRLRPGMRAERLGDEVVLLDVDSNVVLRLVGTRLRSSSGSTGASVTCPGACTAPPISSPTPVS